MSKYLADPYRTAERPSRVTAHEFLAGCRVYFDGKTFAHLQRKPGHQFIHLWTLNASAWRKHIYLYIYKYIYGCACLMSARGVRRSASNPQTVASARVLICFYTTLSPQSLTAPLPHGQAWHFAPQHAALSESGRGKFQLLSPQRRATRSNGQLNNEL